MADKRDAFTAISHNLQAVTTVCAVLVALLLILAAALSAVWLLPVAALPAGVLALRLTWLRWGGEEASQEEDVSSERP